MFITGNDIWISHCVHIIQYIHNWCSVGRLEQRKGNRIFIIFFFVAMDLPQQSLLSNVVASQYAF